MRETHPPDWPSDECLEQMLKRGYLREGYTREDFDALWGLGLVDAAADRAGVAHYDKVVMVLQPKSRKKALRWERQAEQHGILPGSTEAGM